MSPGTGPAVGGSLEVITGTNFTAVSAVTFGITAATDVTDVNSTSITVVDPAGTGTVDVTVGSLHGTSPVSLADQFAYVTSPAIGLPPPSPAPGPGATLVPPPVRTGGSVAASPQGPAYWALGPAGQLSDHGGAANYGSENGVHLNSPINALNSTATGHGYWLVAADGGVFSFGDAKFYGSWSVSTSTRPSSPSPALPTTRDTGWLPPTAGCSASATPSSTGTWSVSTSTNQLPVLSPPLMVTGTGW